MHACVLGRCICKGGGGGGNFEAECLLVLRGNHEAQQLSLVIPRQDSADFSSQPFRGFAFQNTHDYMYCIPISDVPV